MRRALCAKRALLAQAPETNSFEASNKNKLAFSKERRGETSETHSIRILNLLHVKWFRRVKLNCT